MGGTTQGAPTWGTVAWPVPGAKDNPLNAFLVPSNAWNQVTTSVHDTSGNGIGAGCATSWLPAKVQRLRQSADSAEEATASLLRGREANRLE